MARARERLKGRENQGVRERELGLRVRVREREGLSEGEIAGRGGSRWERRKRSVRDRKGTKRERDEKERCVREIMK